MGLWKLIKGEIDEPTKYKVPEKKGYILRDASSLETGNEGYSPNDTSADVEVSETDIESLEEKMKEDSGEEAKWKMKLESIEISPELKEGLGRFLGIFVIVAVFAAIASSSGQGTLPFVLIMLLIFFAMGKKRAKFD